MSNVSFTCARLVEEVCHKTDEFYLPKKLLFISAFLRDMTSILSRTFFYLIIFSREFFYLIKSSRKFFYLIILSYDISQNQHYAKEIYQDSIMKKKH